MEDAVTAFRMDPLPSQVCCFCLPACPRNIAPTHVSVSVLQRMVIHIDTEGNEYNVVPALASFVQRRAKRPVLVVEMHGDPPSIFNANQVCTVCMLPVTLCCADCVCANAAADRGVGVVSSPVHGAH